MELTDTRDIKAPPEVVWAALLDADVLKACIPGCQEMTGSADEGFMATVTQKIGPVKATFKGAVTVADIVAGVSCTLSGEGKGGPAGFAKGSAKVVLTPTPEGTHLEYTAKANVGGKIAQLGSRLIDGVARKMADDFFTRFQKAVEGEDETAGIPGDGADGEKKKGWLGRLTGG